MDLRQSTNYSRRMEGLGWRVVNVKFKIYNLQLFIKPLGIFGAIAKIQRTPFPLPWEELDKILKLNKVWMCKYEPDVKFPNYQIDKLSNFKTQIQELKRNGFKIDKTPLLATKTLVVDLTQSEQELLNSFKKDARYSLRKAQLIGENLPFGVAQGRQFKINDFSGFYTAWEKGSKFKKLWIPPEKEFVGLPKAFGDNCFCVTVIGKSKEGDTTLGGCVVLMHDKVAYYFYSTVLPEGKKLEVPYLVVWEAMREAKKRGCKLWDFEGIYDERFPNKTWAGFTHFKKSWGGKEVNYLGCFTKWRLPW